VADAISNKTLMEYGFQVAKGEFATSKQGSRTPFLPVPGSSAGSSFIDPSQLKAELSEVMMALAEETAHEDLLAVLFTLTTTPSPPP